MLRFKILASAVPLAIAAVFARGELLPGPKPCIEVAGTSVQITDNVTDADFTVIDDIDDAEAGACETSALPQLVAISQNPAASEPLIYLSQDGPADYRIFVRSRTFSARDAAAL